MIRSIIIEKFEKNVIKEFIFDTSTEYDLKWLNEEGELHRINGNPALVEYNGLSHWYNNGKLIRQENAKCYYKQIEEILECFDFYKVHKCMKALKWKWAFIASEQKHGGVPTVEQIKEYAHQLLIKSLEGIDKEDFYIGSGGFYAECNKYKMRLYFSVSEWETI